ncbi:molybdopterin synthase-like protein small subunit CnxG [Pyronema omphalodes]|nr:molybdopterin synthase-like protein small subunit CnxG [Pyronema omphalodes]
MAGNRVRSRVMAGTFKILYFAATTIYTGKDSESLPAPMKLGEMFKLLEQKYPGINGVIQGSMCTVNLDYVEDYELVIAEGDEVAIIPPVSAG